MIVACPLCATRYLIPANLFEAGPRQVRCGRCKHGWQAALEDESVPRESPAPAVAARAEEPPAKTSIIPIELFPSLKSNPLGDVSQKLLQKLPPLTEKIKRLLRLCATALTLLLLFLILILCRQGIAKIAPFMETFYNAIGLTIRHYGEGLSFVKVHSELRYDSGIMKLVVAGAIRNDTRYVQEIPDILASAVGADGQTIQSWQIDAPAATVAAGGSVAFQSSINAPQAAVADINLSLIEKHD
jgi:predicted Zn finger-like uncharacterized protein